MKLLVLGAGGMAGHIAAIELAEYGGHTVTGFARKKLPFCDTIVGDIMNADLQSIVKDYDAVINCIGVLNKAVDAEADKGIWLNSYLPHLLAKHAKRVIHISTDCVFSGHDGGGYAENSFRSADTLYGRSKTLGELNDDRNLTIRTSIVGPEIKDGVGLFHWFMKQNGTVNGYTHAIWGGVTTLVLADAINAALEQGTAGLIHLTNGVPICKFDLLGLFNKLRSEPVEIVPSDLVKEDKSLINGRDDFEFAVPSYVGTVRDMGVWITVHKDLYPQYEVKENI
jgi:dTDP-4-dehydrorhamnose reductase